MVKMSFMLLTSTIAKKGTLSMDSSYLKFLKGKRLLTAVISTRHLNGTVLESFVRPAVLITDAYNALNSQPPRRQRDQEFIGKFLLLFNHSRSLIAV